jgi:glycosyltransferase involved in cell wall biosynthesis
MKPLVSCIIPTRNGERYLGQAIESLLAQSWQPIEIIVVDDGSTDRSAEIAAAFGGSVRVASHPVANPVIARNHGMALASADFLGFLDHDDLWIPDKLTLQMAAFDEDPHLDVCVGMVQRFTQASPQDRMIMVGPAVPGYLTVTMLARRRAFERVGALDPANFHSDSAEWFLRARAHGIGVRLLPRTLVYHRDHDRNRSLIHGNRSRNEFLHLLKSKLDRERGHG